MKLSSYRSYTNLHTLLFNPNTAKHNTMKSTEKPFFFHSFLGVHGKQLRYNYHLHCLYSALYKKCLQMALTIKSIITALQNNFDIQTNVFEMVSKRFVLTIRNRFLTTTGKKKRNVVILTRTIMNLRNLIEYWCQDVSSPSLATTLKSFFKILFYQRSH